MKITLFTSASKRHNYFVNFLSKISTKLYVIQENKNSFFKPNKKNISEIEDNYFKKVQNAEDILFGNYDDIDKQNNIRILKIEYGKLNKLNHFDLKDYLSSDIYIVYGSSIIKEHLLNFLINNKALNIHAGISPYYRGTACNFWALHDGNPEYVGATVHLLSNEIDRGEIVFHALSNIQQNYYIYPMSTLKSAFLGIKDLIINKKINLNNMKSNYDTSREIRFSKKKDFDLSAIKKFNHESIKTLSINFNLSDYINPFFLEY